mmetsp:Transcript_12753/g.15128  ORF Transcript_12753/g.15128 Transcript_12753/m.15128 type:complete len:403 (+) Transcript_12753:197-1405(+)|eukprot:jgi/Bigna1/91486/estExt_fgenesh1_pg.C_1020050
MKEAALDASTVRGLRWRFVVLWVVLLASSVFLLDTYIVPAWILWCNPPWPALPRLNIKKGGVSTAGFSNGADFAHQLHITYSSVIDATCVFAGQPFHCAATRFPDDHLVEAIPASSVPTCVGCPSGKTLIYDHCKAHPEWVDIGALPDYPRRVCDGRGLNTSVCMDHTDNLSDDRVFLFRGTQDRCYKPGSVENVQHLYSMFLEKPEAQIRMVNTVGYAHAFPRNKTKIPGKKHGYDGAGECLRWIYPGGIKPAVDFKRKNIYNYNQDEFMQAISGVGINGRGHLYIPDACSPPTKAAGANADATTALHKTKPCRLVILAAGCNGFGGWIENFAKYAESNDIVLLQPCVGGYVDPFRYPGAHEIKRGMLDVYGQLSRDYTMKSAPHMKFVGQVLEKLSGWKV